MPRYFFNTRDGHCVRDNAGEILADDAAARREGLAVLGEILRYQDESFWNTGEFSVIVLDENARHVVTLTTRATRDDPPETPTP